MPPEILTGSEQRSASAVTLERELARLYDAAAGPTHPTLGVIQARVLNLLCFAPPARFAAARAALAGLVLRQPARALLMAADPTAETSLAAEPSVICRPSASPTERVCCEMIALRAGGEAVTRLAGAALPLLLPDLPTFLWWHAPLPDPAEAAGMAALLRASAMVSDRVITDASEEGDAAPTAILRRAQAWAAAVPSARWSDLSWSRLTPWRKLTARCFDGRAAELFPRLTTVHIVCGGGAAVIGARLYAGWLLAAGGHAEITVRIASDPALTDGLLRIQLEGDGWQVQLEREGPNVGAPASAPLSARASFPKFERHLSGGEPTGRPSGGDEKDAGREDLLLEELRFYPRDRVFAASLGQALALRP